MARLKLFTVAKMQELYAQVCSLLMSLRVDAPTHHSTDSRLPRATWSLIMDITLSVRPVFTATLRASPNDVGRQLLIFSLIAKSIGKLFNEVFINTCFWFAWLK